MCEKYFESGSSNNSWVSLFYGLLHSFLLNNVSKPLYRGLDDLEMIPVGRFLLESVEI